MEDAVTTSKIKDIITLIRKNAYFSFKRFVDIVLSIVGLIFLFPIMILVKISYVISGDHDSILFKHTRICKNGKEFGMYKFRTMVPDSEKILRKLLKNKKIREEWNLNHKLDNDPRITKAGKVLRRLSLDEVPQVINILKGEMSVIGPRPLIQEEIDDYGDDKDLLLSVKPGLTGWWACNGRSCTTPEKRKELELYYAKNCSLALDIKCFFLTIVKVLKKEGAK